MSQKWFKALNSQVMNYLLPAKGLPPKPSQTVPPVGPRIQIPTLGVETGDWRTFLIQGTIGR